MQKQNKTIDNKLKAITTTASSPVIVWSWDNNDPFGANAANSDPDGDLVLFTYNVRLPGQYFDNLNNPLIPKNMIK